MTPERWRQIEDVFQAALDRESEGRSAFLETACADDVELRRGVDSLLAAHETAWSLLDRPALMRSPSQEPVRRPLPEELGAKSVLVSPPPTARSKA